jgi:hypothetical protein
MLRSILSHRGNDDYGSGEFGASRGERPHNGIDYAIKPGEIICSPVAGTITKLGYTYSSDLSYRYVEVTDSAERRHRLFYVLPLVAVGDEVEKHAPVGASQDISKKYTNYGYMKNHVHYEVMLLDGSFANPEKL